MVVLSSEQKVLLNTYNGGEFADLEPKDTFDTLFLFLFRELAPERGTLRAEYVRRLETAIRQIQEVIDALSEA